MERTEALKVLGLHEGAKEMNVSVAFNYKTEPLFAELRKLCAARDVLDPTKSSCVILQIRPDFDPPVDVAEGLVVYVKSGLVTLNTGQSFDFDARLNITEWNWLGRRVRVRSYQGRITSIEELP